jgi:catechol 2,3-dioxygenase-like lactoylglutathione lyase family enzyme
MRPPISQSIVFTYTDDLERASRFFREIMALDFVVDQGACHIFRLTAESYLGVCRLPDRPQGKVGVTISLVSDDVEGWHDFLTQQGVSCVQPPRASPEFGVTSTLFLSPDGYRIEIQRFDDPDWHRSRAEPSNDGDA